MTNAAVTLRPEWLPEVIVEIDVVEPSANANLSFLSTSSGKLDPAFDSTITNYTVCVGYNVQEILLKATASDPKATVSGIGTFKLLADTTVLTVTVTAEDGVTTKDYVVTVIKGCDVGVKEITQDIYNIKVYPNPTNGQLTIASPNPSTRGEQPTIEIVDIMGKCVFTSPNPSKGGEQPTNNVVRQPAPSPLERAGGEVLIDISHLQSGIYFLKINNKLIKLIKN